MNDALPHYMLFSASLDDSEPGRWRFVLRAADGSDRFTADDVEPDVHGDRLELLALVRGLEALSQPSRVTLVAPSRYVLTGVRSGLPEWRKNRWRWEYFGKMVPVKNHDLWKRIDRAMQFHELECRNVRFDAAHEHHPHASSGCQPCRTAQSGRTCEEATPHGSPVRAKTVSADHPRGREWQPPAAHSDERNKSRRPRGGLGKLSGLVKLLTGNRPDGFSPAAVCKEV